MLKTLLVAVMLSLALDAHAQTLSGSRAATLANQGNLEAAARAAQGDFESATTPAARGDALRLWFAIERVQRGDFDASARVATLIANADIEPAQRANLLLLVQAGVPSAGAVARLSQIITASGDPSAWVVRGDAAVHAASGLSCPAEIPDWAMGGLTLARVDAGAHITWICRYASAQEKEWIAISAIAPNEDARAAMSRAMSPLLAAWGVTGQLSASRSPLGLDAPGDLGQVYGFQIGAEAPNTTDYLGAGGILVAQRGNWAVAVGVTTSPQMIEFTGQTLVPGMTRHFLRTIEVEGATAPH